MKTLARSFLLVLGVVVVGVFASGFHPHAEETEDSPPSKVSEAEVDTYIAVYQAMQDDHGLAIEDAIKPHGISLEDFRGSERRIQQEPRLVERVRGALLDHAKKKPFLAQASGPTPIPPAAPVAPAAGSANKAPKGQR